MADKSYEEVMRWAKEQERKEREALREAAKNEGLMGKLIREAGGMSKKEYYKPLASPTKAHMYPPPKRKPSLASKSKPKPKPKPKPKRKPMTVEQKNKVLKGMGLKKEDHWRKMFGKKNKGKNG